MKQRKVKMFIRPSKSDIKEEDNHCKRMTFHLDRKNDICGLRLVV